MLGGREEGGDGGGGGYEYEFWRKVLWRGEGQREQVLQAGEVGREGAEARGEVYSPGGVDYRRCCVGYIGVCVDVETEIWGVEVGGEDDYLWVAVGGRRWDAWLAGCRIGKVAWRERWKWRLEPRC